MQNNFLLKNLPMSISLNFINNSKRFVKARGSTIYEEGDTFNGMINLLLVGGVRLCKRFPMICADNIELIENKETTDLFMPRVEYCVKPVGSRSRGEFLEKDIIHASGSRTETAMIDTESALVVSIDINLLLAVDKTFTLINNLYEIITFQQDSLIQAEERIKSKNLTAAPTNLSTSEAAMQSKLSYNKEEEDNLIYRLNHGMEDPPKRVSIKPGLNTLIFKIPRSRDRSTLSRQQAERDERKRISNSPALNKSLYDGNTNNRRNKQFYISQSHQAELLGRSYSRNDKERKDRERIERVVKNRMDDEQHIHNLMVNDSKVVCRLTVNASYK